MGVNPSATLPFILLLLACIAMATTSPGWRADASPITCSQVASSIAPCVPYLRIPGATVTAACCDGIRALNAAASTTADRQAACRCIKSAAKALPGVHYDQASQLPARCGVNVPYKISPSTDCNSVK